MKRLKQSTAAKIIAVLLAALTALTAFACLTGAVILESCGVYSSTREDVRLTVAKRICDQRTWDVVNAHWSHFEPEEIVVADGFAFQMFDGDRKLIYDGLKNRPTICSYEEKAAVGMPYESWATEPPAETETVIIKGYVLEDIPSSDTALWNELKFFDYGYSCRFELIAVGIVSALLFILLFVYLMAAAGCRSDGTVRGGIIERIPFDVLTVAVIVIVCACAAIFLEVLDGNVWYMLAVRVSVAGVCFFAAGLLALVWCMSLAVHLKLRDTLKSCLCWRILMWCLRICKKPLAVVKETTKGLPLIPKAAVIIAAVLFVEFFWIFATRCDPEGIIFGWLIERAVLVTLTLYVLLCMKKLLLAGKEIASGNFAYKVDTAKMRGSMREHAESLNSITDGMNTAVAERMKSERLRTELITNVSHDIKTPLTSIINYVDLLEKEKPESETMREYLAVLSRQSSRLKKLIEDLLEASKASTGNIAVNPEQCTLNVLIDQTVGEYAEKLEAKELELIVRTEDKPVDIMADGRHMWRIFDNLMNNICKYAKSGTRVYIDLESRNGKAAVIFRNISEQQLNARGNELAERFVRGDSSRATEGSGLGLSIAQSLAKLQRGEMNVTVDGDLFKVELVFETI